MKSLIEKLKPYANGQITLIALAFVVAAILTMGQYIVPSIEAIQPDAISNGQLILVDFKPLSSAEDTYKIFNLYSPAILGWVRTMYAADFVFAISFGILGFGLIGLLLKYLGKIETWGWLMFLPILGAIFDCAENILVLFLLSQNPTHVYSGLAGFTGVIIALKTLFDMSGNLSVVILLLAAFVKFAMARLQPKTT